jgi:stage V sporulation protein R
VIRDFRLFTVADHESKSFLEIDSIHNEEGYRRVRRLLAHHYNRDASMPDVQVVRYERDTDRSLVLRHRIHRNRPLVATEATEVLKHLARLWGFTVRLEAVDADGRLDHYRECTA